MKHVRTWFADRIWKVADWLYPYVRDDFDLSKQQAWEMTATYVGTEAEAQEWFDKLCGLSCTRDEPLHDCSFVVGTLKPVDDGPRLDPEGPVAASPGVQPSSGQSEGPRDSSAPHGGWTDEDSPDFSPIATTSGSGIRVIYKPQDKGSQ